MSRLTEPQNNEIKSKNDPKKNVYIGAFAGSVAYTFTCPIEVVQARLQSTVDLRRVKDRPSSIKIPYVTFCRDTYKPKMTCISLKNNYATIVRDIVRNDGFFGFYKGYLASIIGIGPSRALYFASNFAYREKLSLIIDKKKYADAIHGVSAFLASITASTATCPIWVVKTNLQLTRHMLTHKVTVLEMVKKIYNTHGLSGFYRGLSSSYYGALETMLYWILYERLKNYYHNLNITNNINKLSSFQDAQAAFFCKFTVMLIGYPHEVARTRMRQGLMDERGALVYREFWSTLYKIYRQEGFRNLYNGLGLQMLRQIPNNIIIFVIFERLWKL